MSHRITITLNDGTRKRVTGWPTSNKHVWVTRDFNDAKKFALTHKPSGLAILRSMPSLEVADFGWSVVRQFPIAWHEDKPSAGIYNPVLIALRQFFSEVSA